MAIYSGFDGSVLETFTSTLAGANVGFDAVGLGDINGDERLDFLLAGATGDVVYVVSSSQAATPIPTVSEWGAIVLALSVLIAGTMLQRSNIALRAC